MAEFAQGSLISFAGGNVARVVSVTALNTSSAVTDVTLLSQKAGYKEKAFSQLVDHESFEVTMYSDFSTGTGVANWIPAHGAVVDVIISSPDNATQIFGHGAIIGSSTGDLVSDEVVVSTRTIQFLGGTSSDTITPRTTP